MQSSFRRTYRNFKVYEGVIQKDKSIGLKAHVDEKHFENEEKDNLALTVRDVKKKFLTY